MSLARNQLLLRQLLSRRHHCLFGSSQVVIARVATHFQDHNGLRFLSTQSKSTAVVDLKQPLVCPSKYVDGATVEQLLTDPEFAEFMKANFPQDYDPDYAPGKLGAVTGLDPRLVNVLKKSFEEREEEDRLKRLKREESKKVYPRNIRPLTAYVRDRGNETNSRRANFIRRYEQMVPGIITGGDPRINLISLDREACEVTVKTPHNLVQRELDRYYLNFEDSRVYNLTVYQNEDDKEGTVYQVVPKNVNWHPTKREVFCVNYVRYHPGRPLWLPIKEINQEESAALKRDCFIIYMTRKIQVLVDEGVTIPDFLDLDCSGLKLREVVRRDRIVLPEGIRFGKAVLQRSFVDFVIGKVEGRMRDVAGAEDDAPSKK